MFSHLASGLSFAETLIMAFSLKLWKLFQTLQKDNFHRAFSAVLVTLTQFQDHRSIWNMKLQVTYMLLTSYYLVQFKLCMVVTLIDKRTVLSKCFLWLLYLFRTLKVFVMVTSINLYIFIPLVVTLTYFEHHRRVWKIQIFFSFESDDVSQLSICYSFCIPSKAQRTWTPVCLYILF